MTSATNTPNVKISSGSANSNPAGACPLSMSSSMTLLPVHEPRPLGMAKILSVMISPLSGW
ncbi:hypothetical protein D3C80_1639490 [compost metagenome]